MSEIILNTNILPSPIREQFNTHQIIFQSHKKGVILMPFKNIITQRGIAKGSSFTTDELIKNRKDDVNMESTGTDI
jgi:hypothetical protein